MDVILFVCLFACVVLFCFVLGFFLSFFVVVILDLLLTTSRMWDHISTGQSGTSLQNIEVSFQCSGTQKQLTRLSNSFFISVYIYLFNLFIVELISVLNIHDIIIFVAGQSSVKTLCLV